MEAPRQLGLFKGRRQRGVTVRSQAGEFELHCAIADTLRVSLNKGWMFFHCPNGEERNKVVAQKLKRMGVKPGVPDLILISPTGRHYYLELKTKYGRLTDAQIDFMSDLEERHVMYGTAVGYDEAIAWLKQWGAVRVSL